VRASSLLRGCLPEINTKEFNTMKVKNLKSRIYAIPYGSIFEKITSKMSFIKNAGRYGYISANDKRGEF